MTKTTSTIHTRENTKNIERIFSDWPFMIHKQRIQTMAYLYLQCKINWNCSTVFPLCICIFALHHLRAQNPNTLFLLYVGVDFLIFFFFIAAITEKSKLMLVNTQWIIDIKFGFYLLFQQQPNMCITCRWKHGIDFCHSCISIGLSDKGCFLIIAIIAAILTCFVKLLNNSWYVRATHSHHWWHFLCTHTISIVMQCHTMKTSKRPINYFAFLPFYILFIEILKINFKSTQF